jgi:hypothetical protein
MPAEMAGKSAMLGARRGCCRSAGLFSASSSCTSLPTEQRLQGQELVANITQDDDCSCSAFSYGAFFGARPVRHAGGSDRRDPDRSRLFAACVGRR